jgi:hypothetical protein
VQELELELVAVAADEPAFQDGRAGQRGPVERAVERAAAIVTA